MKLAGEDAAVLILVVVEDGLRGTGQRRKGASGVRLNPCCCGRWSQSLMVLS